MYPIIRLAMLAALAMLASPLGAQTPRNASLPGHVIRALANATRLPHTRQMDEEPITVTVVLNLSDPQGAEALEEEYSTPTSPNYHQTITVFDFTSRFGPTQEAWDAVLAYLEQNGLTLSHSTIDRMTMSVTGTRAQVQEAFHVMVDNYQLGDRTFHAVASDPVVPATIAPWIATVAGLSDLARPHLFNTPSFPVPASLATAYNGTLTPSGTTNTGGLPPGLDGKGTTIGLLEDDGFALSDVSNWLSYASLPANLINHIHVYSAVTPSGCSPLSAGCGTSEVLLDIAAALGIAPGAKIEIFESALDSASIATAMDDAIIDLASFSTPAVLSMSFGYCEDSMSQGDAAYLDQFAAVSLLYGVSLFASTGDTGSTCAGTEPNTIPAPADSPHVVAVGGTNVNVDSNNSYDSEGWWHCCGGSGGFGTSRYFSEPGYQSKLYPGAAGRSVPDVSMEAAPSVTICQPSCFNASGQPYVSGGTSLSAPLWAGTWALLQQARSDAGMFTPSAAHGYIYTLADGLHAASTMTDTDFQHVGLGSPNITKLIAIAVPPAIGSFSPTNGSFAGGTKVTIYGLGFIGVKDVTFGGYPGTNLRIESDNRLTVDTPFANDNAAAEVKVATPGGTANANSFGRFDYDPIIDFVRPTFGSVAGGTTVTVTGIALSDNLTFEFIAPGESDHKATQVSCSNQHTSCKMLSPAHLPGTVNVVAVAPWGYTSPVQPMYDQFTYYPAPVK